MNNPPTLNGLFLFITICSNAWMITGQYSYIYCCNSFLYHLRIFSNRWAYPPSFIALPGQLQKSHLHNRRWLLFNQSYLPKFLFTSNWDTRQDPPIDLKRQNGRCPRSCSSNSSEPIFAILHESYKHCHWHTRLHRPNVSYRLSARAERHSYAPISNSRQIHGRLS